jgi:hypothetical protein
MKVYFLKKKIILEIPTMDIWKELEVSSLRTSEINIVEFDFYRIIKSKISILDERKNN